MNDKNTQWLHSVKDSVADFLKELEGEKRPGFFRYSLSGDYFGEGVKWGLGNSVFFLKIVYTLGLEEKFSAEVKNAQEYIQSFQKKNGLFYDPIVNFLSKPLQLKSFIRSKNLDDIFGTQTKRAETRQSISALGLYGVKPVYEYRDFPQSKEGIFKYLSELDWEHPWGAGSHFSHLLFFLGNSELDNKNELIDFAISWVNSIQNDSDGLWYRGTPNMSQKINGAMKIITGLKAVGKVKFRYPEKILDSALIATNDKHACDNFNVTYVIKYCNEALEGAYRFDEIKEFIYNRLSLYREYYFQEIGGFSFKKKRANRVYYNAPISRGKNEPDIHGTVMFLWGISLIAQILGIDNELGFREFIT